MVLRPAEVSQLSLCLESTIFLSITMQATWDVQFQATYLFLAVIQYLVSSCSYCPLGLCMMLPHPLLP
jgi:hypothetical protein